MLDQCLRIVAKIGVYKKRRAPVLFRLFPDLDTRSGCIDKTHAFSRGSSRFSQSRYTRSGEHLAACT